ncbi:cutinase [Melampsora larici-populina 98AG31]|uniref:Cutinase n=1 Tax=Melampsora larici-populina (strain 98AG31 / pathotype 3-4-7) TaxID=747676 RepID=F4S2G6_MELLP|nr:cutinase [Melampsora larici-populina 98AG31]EGG01209.1 cutinase [Melampsora larici-populina 98AG31]
MSFILPLVRSVFFLRAFFVLIILGAYSQSKVPPAQSKHQKLSDSDECPSYTIISVRGTSEPQTHPVCCSGFIKGVLSTVPGGKNYEVIYPATMDFITGPLTAADDTIRYVESIDKRCPNQPFILIGYSQGAMGVVRSLMRDEMQDKNVVAVVMYGNPYRTPGSLENAGTATDGRGLEAISDVRLPERYQFVTLDICLLGDIVCSGRGGMKAHLRYKGSPQEQEAVRFAANNLQGKQGRILQTSFDIDQ